MTVAGAISGVQREAIAVTADVGDLSQIDAMVRAALAAYGQIDILVATPGGQQLPLKEFADIQVQNGASFIYRENNSRYIGVQFSVEGRDLASAVENLRARPHRLDSCMQAMAMTTVSKVALWARIKALVR